MEDTKAKSGRLGSSILISLATFMVTIVVGFANGVIIARFAGPEGSGLYGVLNTALSFAVPLLSIGLGRAVTYLLAQGESPGRVRGMLHLQTAPVLLLLPAAGAWYVWGYRPLDTTTSISLSVLVSLPAFIYIDAVRGIHLGERRPAVYEAILVARLVGLTVLNAAALHLGAHWIFLSVIISAWTVALGLLVRELVDFRRLVRPAAQLWRRSVRYGAGAAARTLGAQALLRLEYVVLAPIIGLHELGLYAVADQMCGLLAEGGAVVGRMILPESAEDPDGARSFGKLGVALRLSLAMAVVGGLALAAVGWYLIPLVFGSSFEPSYLAILVLLPAAWFRCAHEPLAGYLAGRDQQRVVVRATATSSVIDIVLLVLVVPVFGWLSAGAVKGVVYLVQLVLTTRALHTVQPGEPALRWVVQRDDLRILWGWFAARWPGVRGGGG